MNYLIYYLSAAAVLCLSLEIRQAHADPQAGKAKFGQICAVCHGPEGKGNGPAAQGLAIRPKDLSATKRSDAELKKIIKEGGPSAGLSPLMPPWGSSLSEQDLNNIIVYLRSLGRK